MTLKVSVEGTIGRMTGVVNAWAVVARRGRAVVVSFILGVWAF